MCGICFVVRCAELRPHAALLCGEGVPEGAPPEGGLPEEVCGLLRRRGPHVWGSEEYAWGTLGAAVLHMRGRDGPVRQPHFTSSVDDGALLWNGEAFGGIPEAADEVVSDTIGVHRLLCEADDMVAALQRIEGPYAFALWRKGVLWFGRDPLGRRSLVWKGGRGGMVVASVSDGEGYREVPTGGIFSLSQADGCLSMAHHPWAVQLPLRMRTLLASTQEVTCNRAVELYMAALTEAVRRRACLACRPAGGARVAVLYSGGLDSAVLAALAHTTLPEGEPIDLINVAFGDWVQHTPDRLAGRQGWRELRNLFPTREWRFVEVDITAEGVLDAAPHIQKLVSPASTIMDINIGSALWFASRGAGRLVPDEEAERGLAPPSLLRQPRGEGEEKLDGEHGEFTPLVHAVHSEVQLSRKWVDLGELSKFHKLPWKRLGYKRARDYVEAAVKRGLVCMEGTGPNIRVGRPVEGEHSDGEEDEGHQAPGVAYESAARAVLVGMGADETLGGYSRYRVVFQRGGAEALADEMQGDFDRLWRRNLGRDDRIISDNGREARFPFLDEGVLRTLASLPFHTVCDLTAPAGDGDKRILREVARRLGLSFPARLQKRAIQFGTRLANSKVDGTMPIPREGLREALAACLNKSALKDGAR